MENDQKIKISNQIIALLKSHTLTSGEAHQIAKHTADMISNAIIKKGESIPFNLAMSI